MQRLTLAPIIGITWFGREHESKRIDDVGPSLASAIAIEDAALVTVTWDRDLAAAAIARGHAVSPASP